jgi:hypothetical protein
MPVGNVKKAERNKGRSLDVLNAIKRSKFVVETAIVCLAHAFVIPMAQGNGDPKDKSYRNVEL